MKITYHHGKVFKQVICFGQNIGKSIPFKRSCFFIVHCDTVRRTQMATEPTKLYYSDMKITVRQWNYFSAAILPTSHFETKASSIFSFDAHSSTGPWNLFQGRAERNHKTLFFFFEKSNCVFFFIRITCPVEYSKRHAMPMNHIDNWTNSIESCRWHYHYWETTDSCGNT